MGGYSPEEYLRLERDATERHQYFLGEIFPIHSGPTVTGRSDQHSRVVGNIVGSLARRQLGSRYAVFDRNLRVSIPSAKSFTNPDVTVVCGPLQFDPLEPRQEILLNPTLIVEVLSPLTEVYDRVGKFENYRDIESFREYVLVSQDVARVETFRHCPDGAWLYTSAARLEADVRLHSLEIPLPLTEIYAGVPFPPVPSQPVPEEPGSPT